MTNLKTTKNLQCALGAVEKLTKEGTIHNTKEGRDTLVRFVFAGVKHVIAWNGSIQDLKRKSMGMNQEEISGLFGFTVKLSEMVKLHIGKLTANEFLQTFPPIKYYKDDDSKNYYFTVNGVREYLQELGIDYDTPLDSAEDFDVENFLWLQSNKTMIDFQVAELTAMSRVMTHEGYAHPVSMFLEKERIANTEINVLTDKKGRRFYFNHKTQAKVYLDEKDYYVRGNLIVLKRSI